MRKCEFRIKNMPESKLDVPTEHAWEGCVWWQVIHWLRLFSLYGLAGGINHVSTEK